MKNIYNKIKGIFSPDTKGMQLSQDPNERDKQIKNLNFARALTLAAGGVVVLLILNLIVYKPPQTVDEDPTRTQLQTILPTGARGSILKSVDGKTTYLVLSNLTQDEFREMVNKKVELQNALGVDNLEIQPSGSALRSWEEVPETTGPDNIEDHEGEEGF